MEQIFTCLKYSKRNVFYDTKLTNASAVDVLMHTFKTVTFLDDPVFFHLLDVNGNHKTQNTVDTRGTSVRHRYR